MANEKSKTAKPTEGRPLAEGKVATHGVYCVCRKCDYTNQVDDWTSFVA